MSTNKRSKIDSVINDGSTAHKCYVPRHKARLGYSNFITEWMLATVSLIPQC